MLLERRLAVADAQLALSAISTLGVGERRAGAEALICLCERYQLDRGERILTSWLQRQGLAAAREQAMCVAWSRPVAGGLGLKPLPVAHEIQGSQLLASLSDQVALMGTFP